MLAKVLRLVFCNHVMQRSGKEREESVVLAYDTVCKTAVLPSGQMLVVDVEGRELICSHAPDLGNVVLVRCGGTRRRGAGRKRIFDEAEIPIVSNGR